MYRNASQNIVSVFGSVLCVCVELQMETGKVVGSCGLPLWCLTKRVVSVCFRSICVIPLVGPTPDKSPEPAKHTRFARVLF